MTAAADALSYDDLYARWERGSWSATELDFSQDREDWAALTAFERRAAVWNYALFLHGEDVVADDLGPFVDAAPREEQRYFLATQQADEARHAVFFKRFLEEVAGVRGDGSVRGALDALRPQLTWGFVRTFGMLDEVTDALRRDRSRTALARAVTMYHLVVEGTLAQPGQHFIADYLERRQILPAFREGMHNVVMDEQRHIGFGMKLLRDLAREDPGVPEAVAATLRESLPYTVSLFWPPGGDRRYTEVFGFTLEQIYEEGARSLEAKLRSAGMPLESLPGPMVMPVELPPSERAERALDLVRHGIMGGGEVPVSREPEAQEVLFDTLRRAVDPAAAGGSPICVQWDFTDAPAWQLRVADGQASALPGRAASADVTLRCRYADWVDVVGRRAHPLALTARGRLRPRGSPRALARMRRLFP